MVRYVILRCFAVLFCLSTAVAAQAKDAKIYFFGNSLIHHLSEDEPHTNVPYWLTQLAQANGDAFQMDGQWGFVRNFVDQLPPRANWSIDGVEGAWNSRLDRFSRAGWTGIVMNPANFIQYQPADRLYDGENPSQESPLSATLRLFDWVHRDQPDVPFYIYEGWAEMAGVAGGFPPSRRGKRKYHAYNQGDYHAWYEDLVAQIQTARPEMQVSLIPVASTLSRLLTEGPFNQIDARDLYSDDAPHGRPTLYFLAALIAYEPLFGTAPPAQMELPASIHPIVRENYATLVTALGSDTVQRSVAPEVTVADTQPEAPVAAVAVAEPETQPQPSTPRVASGPAGEVPNQAPALAMGLNGIADWSTQHPFVNAMKTARPWIGHLPGQWGGVDAKQLRAEGHLNEHGWPLRVPEGVTKLETFLFTDQPEDSTYLTGTWLVRYEGQGNLSIGGRAKKVQLNDGQGSFEYTPGEGLVALTLFDTDPNDPIRNVAIFKEEHLDLFEAGALFNPVWLEKIEDLRSIRFMDWMQTNASLIARWDDRPQMQDYTWVEQGVPLPVMVALSNHIGADPWFNMPHLVDDAYVRNFATYVRDHLDPALKAYVEYSNEVWNFIFPQAVHARDMSEVLWGRRDDGWMQYYGLRSAQVMDIWSEVFGADQMDRLVRVVATHTGWQGLEEFALTGRQARRALGKDPQDSFDAYAITGYFGFEMGGDEYASRLNAWLDESQAVARAEAERQGLRRLRLQMFIDENGFEGAFEPVFRTLRDGSVRELTDLIFPYHSGAAKAAGLDLIMYEGGTHVAGHGAQTGDDRLTAFFTRFNYSPQMADLYRQLIEGYTEAGGQLFNAFVDIAPASQFGSWGSLRHLDDQNSRWDILMDLNTAGDGGWQGRDPTDFANGLRLTGSSAADQMEGSVRPDVLLGGAGDDVLISYGGSDHLHGGPGRDTAVLPGAQGDWSLERTDVGVIARAGPVTVHLAAIETVQFGDGTVDLTVLQ